MQAIEWKSDMPANRSVWFLWEHFVCLELDVLVEEAVDNDVLCLCELDTEVDAF